MTNLCKNSTTLTTAILLLLLIGLISYGQQHLRFAAEAGEGVCTEYDQTENTLNVNCNSSFPAVARAINDPEIVENLGNGEYLLNATLEIADDITFEMNSSNADDNIQYLKIVGENGIIVDGKILIDGIKITSWNISSNNIVSQDMNGSIRRGYIQFAASEGSQIINSEFGFLGDVEPGLRGFDLLGDGDGEPSHDMVIRGNKFHDMWMGFYSNGAYNIVIDGNEYYNNIKYTVDPHTVTHDMNITNNQIYNNTIEGGTSQGIYLFNPVQPDDGVTQGNLVYNNTIINSENGVVATRSHDNIVQNTTFYDIEESEYRLSGDSSIRIKGQHFDNALISQDGSLTTIRH